MGIEIKSVLVIGAGMSGLSAAARLVEAGLSVTLLDKGWAPGGRMATRRIVLENGQTLRVDHGAQFFTARSEPFKDAVAAWQAEGLVSPWCSGFPKTASSPAPSGGHPRFMSPRGMNAIPALLAKGLDLHQKQVVTHVAHDGDAWIVTTDTQQTWSADALLITSPVPQTLSLLDASDHPLPRAVREELEAITYHCCLAVMAVLDGPSGLPDPGAIQFHAEPVDWIADARTKGTIKEGFAVTIHGAPLFSREHFEGDRKIAGALLLESCRTLLQSKVLDVSIHGWRFAAPVTQYPQRCLSLLGETAPLVLAGDAFGECRVEGAFLSGCAAADAVLQLGRL